MNTKLLRRLLVMGALALAVLASFSALSGYEALGIGLLSLAVAATLVYMYLLNGSSVRRARQLEKRQNRQIVDDVQRHIDTALAKLTTEISGKMAAPARPSPVPAVQLQEKASAALHKPEAKTSEKPKAQSRTDFPPLRIDDKVAPNSPWRVGVILDEFTARAFSFEWHQVQLMPDSWSDQLDSEDLDFIFVESAWAGNDGAWLYHLTGSSAPRPAFAELIREARRRGIPTIFWNKEDPPHYADFLDSARLFDYVFTSDGNKVESYKRDLGHDRVDVLAFAAQPRIHNPARLAGLQRSREVAFGGMYFRHKYPERRSQMDYLLPSAAKFGLDIFSRQLGGNADYQFPHPFDKRVVGSLSYEKMVAAYHAYKVFLNVNSVVDSETMCARRIFEITACGAAVVSAPSPAIGNYFPGGEIWAVGTERECDTALKTLLRSPEHRDRHVHRGQRVVWNHHTYEHRVRQIVKAAGLDETPTRRPLISIVLPTIRPQQLEHVLRTVGSQVGVDAELVLLLHGFECDELELRAQAAAAGVRRLVLLKEPRTTSLGACLNLLVSASSGEYITKMDDDDLYGPMYLADLLNAQRFSGAGLVGKAAAYCYFASSDSTVLLASAKEHTYSDFVRGSTLFGPRRTFTETPFQDLPTSEDSTFLREYLSKGGKIYAADRFNYAIHRGGPDANHTWKVADAELYASGELKFFGRPEANVFT